MPFKIIRNDITKVKADVIVNTANPKPIYASGTDRAIYQAAGADMLLNERKAIGCIERGDIAVTGAYALNAKYIIHTVGPMWTDGKHGEFKTLESCYTKSLHKALELNCKSIAFPLISSGVYGFPRDKALQIAVSAFSRFLLENEMQIILVVFDKKAFQLSEQLVGEVDSFIDANYIRRKRDSEYSDRRYTESEIESVAAYDAEVYEERLRYRDAEYNSADGSMSFSEPYTEQFLEKELDNVGMSFHDKLFELIGKAEMDNKDVWKRANLDRKHFSKIQCNKEYHPKKKTVMALCIALKLDLEQSVDLLARADWAFSPSSKVDLIVKKAIIDKQYDIYQLNLVLFKYTNEILGI